MELISRMEGFEITYAKCFVLIVTQWYHRWPWWLSFSRGSSWSSIKKNDFSVICFVVCPGFGVSASTIPVGRRVIAVVRGTIRGAGGPPWGSRAMSVKVSPGAGTLGRKAPPMTPSLISAWGLDACVLSRFSRIWLCMTLWTVAHQASLFMGFPRQEYWSGLPCPPPGNLPNPGIKPTSLMSPALAGGFFTSSAAWEACLRTEGSVFPVLMTRAVSCQS